MRNQSARDRGEHPDRPLAELVAAQHGLVTHAQLRTLGLSASSIHRRIQNGRLHLVHRGVYTVGHRLLVTPHGRWLAAALASGPDSLLSHLDAAALWRLIPARSGVVHVTVPPRSGRRCRPGIRVHRSRIDHPDRAGREHVPVSSLSWTLIDVAAVLPRRRTERAIDEAAFLYGLEDRTLTAALDRAGSHPGTRALATILAEHTPGSTRTRSELEERFLRLCGDHGLPRPLVNVVVAGLEVDFLFRDARLVVETDGYAAHAPRKSFERDHDRDARLRDADYRVSRFTYRQVTDRAAWVARSVAGDLDRRTGARSPT